MSDLVEKWRANCIKCERGMSEMRWSPGDRYYFYCIENECDLSDELFKLKLNRVHFNEYADRKFKD